MNRGRRVRNRSSELTAAGLAGLGPGNDCDREPIHLAGAVQPHGYLLAVDPATWVVEVASENVEEFLGATPSAVLGRQLSEVLGAQVAAVAVATSGRELLDPEVVTVTLPSGPEERRRQDLTVHRCGGLVVCELEQSGAVSDDAIVGFYQAANRAMSRLHERFDVQALCATAVTELRALTGYDRVMVYRFDDDAHGEVVAEARRPEAEPFLGLRYPAGDIPRQARRLYLRNWLRVIADVDYTPAPLVARPGSLPDEGLDLTLSALRSVSPTHLRYLRNMGVRATLTISLVVDGQLWGMLACHHDNPRLGSGHLRAACATFGQSLSLQLRAASALHDHDNATRLARHCSAVVAALAGADSLAVGARSVPEDLLGMVGATGAVLAAGGRRTTVGAVPPDDVLDLVLTAVRQRVGEQHDPFADDAAARLVEATLGADVWQRSGLDASAVAEAAAGVLYLPLGLGPDDYVLWLREERARAVRWAGRESVGPKGLTPRASFEEWRELVRGLSAPWRPVEVASARELGRAYPELTLHRSRNRLTRLAMFDILTGLPNRAMLLDRLSGELEAAADAPGRILAVMYFDLDRFAEVNAAYGRDAGDELLVSLAGRLSSSLRTDDVLARVGGDEFVLVVPSVTGVEQAVSIAHRMVEQCRITFPISPERTAQVSVSMGIALHHGAGDADGLLRRADNALYLAKRAGRDQIRVYGMEHEAESEDSRLETELDLAIIAEQLVVYLQPVIRFNSGSEAGSGAGSGADGGPYFGGQLDGAEALVRWQHPERGLVPPDRFIPLAERTGQIDAVGRYVLERALRALAAWPSGRWTCAVNVSAVEVGRPGFAAAVRQRLAEHGVDPGRLCLEITETQMMQRPELVCAVLTELGAAGIRIAIDDFGTGFSSLAYVRDLPAHILKIDRSFVAALPDSRRDVAVVAAAIRLAHEMGMEVVAEGVETPAQVEALRALHCDLAQGYLFARPMPIPEFDAVVEAQKSS